MTAVPRIAQAFVLAAATLLATTGEEARAASPNCASEGGTLLSWPSVEPIWEFCWIPPGASSGPRGSGLELRAVHYRGIPVARRIHAPMLFAEYDPNLTTTCYRDWKDDPTAILAHSSTHNTLAVPPDLSRLATTSCSVSQHPTQSYGTCPFGQPTGGGYSCTSGGGIVIEDLGDQVTLTSQYRADWYMYDSRISFRTNGTIEPSFGFGNSNGTFNNRTHWHHNYWRFDFGIDGQDSHIVASNGVDQASEFSDLRGAPGSKTWSVRNPASGRGFQFIPSDNDYLVATNESGRGFHMVDFMATRYKPNEYGDNPNYSLGDCGMNQNALVDGENIHQQDVVLYYRVAVRDATANSWPPGCGGGGTPCIPQDSMVCKSAGPRLVAFGNWGQGLPDEADLSVSGQSEPAIAAPGGTVSLAITVANEGPQDSNELELTFDLPSALSLAASQTGLGDFDCSATGGHQVTCALDAGTLPALGQIGFSLALDVEPISGDGDVDTIVTVTSNQWTDPDTSNNVAAITTTIQAPTGQADLSVSGQSLPPGVAAGQTFNLSITVVNDGPLDTSSVVVTIDLPSALGYAGNQPGLGDFGCAEVGVSQVSCELGTGTLAASSQRGFSVALQVDAAASAGDVDTAVAVSSTQWSDPDTSNNTALVRTTIKPAVTGADLSVSAQSSPGTVSAGGSFDLNIWTTNLGPETVSQLRVSIDLPPQLPIPATLPSPLGWSCAAGKLASIECDMVGASIQAGQTAFLAVPLSVSANALSGTVLTQVSASSEQWDDPDLDDNQTSVATTILGGPSAVIFRNGFE